MAEKETITSVEEYITTVKKIYCENHKYEDKTKHLFFRGHSKKSYELIPSVFRNEIDEKEVILDFVHYGPQHNINYEFEKERIQILTDMQHNEIPTRLLDWTFAPLNALFFAVKGKECKEDGEVIVLNPWCYNQRIINYQGHPRIQDIHIHARALLSSSYDIDYIKSYLKKKFRLTEDSFNFKEIELYNFEKPIALVSNYTNNRILHQRGAFTLHGTDKDAINKWNEFKNNSWRIIIDKGKKEEIYNDLNKLYINHYSIYPDFNGMKSQIENRKGLFNL